MKLVSKDGSLVPVRRRFNFVGSDMGGFSGSLGYAPSGLFGWSNTAELVPGPGGKRMFANFYDIYRSNPWVFACVNLISWSLSRLPLKLYELDADGNRTQIRGDVPATPGRNSAAQNIARVLHRPGPRVSRIVMFRKLATDFLIAGNGLLEKQRGPIGVNGLTQRPWRRVNVVLSKNDDDPVSYYEIIPREATTGIENRRLIPEDVVHIDIGNDPEWPVGMSPMHSFKYTIALYNAIQRHLTAFFGNQARTAGHLKLEKGTSREVLAFIREELAQIYASPENAGRPMVTSGEWQTVSVDPQHSSIADLVKLSREEVVAGYGVAPPLVGILDRAIMGNIRELRSHHLRDVVGPWAVLFEDSIEAQLLDTPTLANDFLEFDMGETLRPDFEARAAAMRDFQNTYALNERRKLENLPRIDNPDADAVYLPMNESPVGANTPPTGDPGADPTGASDNGHHRQTYVRIGPKVEV